MAERVEYFVETLTDLVLHVEPSGRKSWRVVFRVNNRWRQGVFIGQRSRVNWQFSVD